MKLADPIAHAPWRAELALDYERRDARTVLARRRHDGPLVVQKPLYPEGEDLCHTIIVHPPAGIAGGDELALMVSTGVGARSLLTTPGAGKWYRTAGPWARQQLQFDVASGASLEWLPQETIVFDGACADLHADIRLQGDACFVGWDVICFGRTGSGEKFTRGEFRSRTSIARDGRMIWLERARCAGGDAMLASDVVLAAQPVVGTFIVAAPTFKRELIGACRAQRPARGEGAVTLLPEVFVGRYLGASSEAAKDYFAQLWRIVRPAVIGRDAQVPRIWGT